MGAGANNLFAMIPNQTAGGQVSSISINGATVSCTVQTIKGRSLREKAKAAAASTLDTYESGATPLTSQALARAEQARAGVLRVYLSEVRFKERSKDIVSETYVLQLSNPDRSPAWKATLRYQDSLLEPLFYLLRFSFGDPAPGREEALADKAIELMQQQSVLK